MYIKVFTDGAAVIISEERDRTCSNPQGHDFNPDNGAMHGAYGNCCAHCNHFVGRHEEMRDAEEAQAYAQAMLGATGPVEVREMNFELLFDSGGGITLITPSYCHAYDNSQHAAYDTAALLDGADPQGWDGNHPESRRERHPEDDVMTADTAQAIREGGPWKRRGHAWNEFCAALAPPMTQDELLLAESAAVRCIPRVNIEEVRHA